MKIWEIVKQLEEEKSTDLSELKEGKATMIVNFGENGRTWKGLIDHTDSLTAMIIKVFRYYSNL